MKPKNVDFRCKATTKSGKRCGAAQTEGGLCYFHGNPDKASELGRIGGSRNKRRGAETAGPLPRVDNAKGVQETVARLIDEVHSGKLNPKIAGRLVSLLSLQLRAIEATDLESRLERVERLLEVPPG